MEALGRVAVIDRSSGDRKIRELARKLACSKERQLEAAESFNRVLARIVEGEYVPPMIREPLSNLLKGKTEFKLVLQKQRKGRTSRPAQSLEVAAFIFEQTEFHGDNLRTAVDAAMEEFGLKRRRIFELMKEGRRKHRKFFELAEGKEVTGGEHWIIRRGY
jgi:hypothetical protein